MQQVLLPLAQVFLDGATHVNALFFGVFDSIASIVDPFGKVIEKWYDDRAKYNNLKWVEQVVQEVWVVGHLARHVVVDV